MNLPNSGQGRTVGGSPRGKAVRQVGQAKQWFKMTFQELWVGLGWSRIFLGLPWRGCLYIEFVKYTIIYCGKALTRELPLALKRLSILVYLCI